MESDLTYHTSGFFTTFFPETKAGEAIYSEIIEQNQGSPKILTRDLKITIHQIKKAGYSVKKSKKPTAKDLNEILNDPDFLDLI